MKTITQILTIWLFTSAAMAADSSSARVFQLRLVADAPSDETELMTLIHQRDGKTNSETLYVSKLVSLDQRALKAAKVIPGSGTSGTRIQIEFTQEGKKQFAELTRTNIGKRLGIIIDGQLCSAPVIRTEITGGIGEISGTFTQAEANDFAAKITESLESP